MNDLSYMINLAATGRNLAAHEGGKKKHARWSVTSFKMSPLVGNCNSYTIPGSIILIILLQELLHCRDNIRCMKRS